MNCVKKLSLGALIVLLSFLVFSCGTLTSVEDSRSQEERVAEEISFFQKADDADRALTVIEETLASEGTLTEETRRLYSGLLLTSGRYEDALRESEILLQENPEDPDALLTRILVFIQDDEKDKARGELEKAAAAHPDRADFPALRGQLELSEERFREARSWFEKALEIEKTNVTALGGLGNLELQRDEKEGFEKAVELFTQALEIDSDAAYLYADRARAERELGWVNRAEDDYTRAIERESESAWLYMDRGRLRLLSRAKPELAEEDFLRVVDLDEENLLAWAYLASIYEERGDMEAAAKAFGKTYELKPDYYPSYAVYGGVLYTLERWEEAYAYFQKAYEYNPGEPAHSLLAALTLYRKGSPREAGSYINKKSARIPQDIALYEIARYLASGGSDYRAQMAVSEEKDRNIKLRGLFYLAEMAKAQGQDASAKSYLEQIESIKTAPLRHSDNPLDAYLQQYDQPISGYDLEIRMAERELRKLRQSSR